MEFFTISMLNGVSFGLLLFLLSSGLTLIFSMMGVHNFGHVPELLITFGLSFVIIELVLLVWGRSSVEFPPPEILRGPAFTLINSSATGLQLVAGAAPAALCTSADSA